MKKAFLLFLLAILFSPIIRAQDESDEDSKFQLGINATYFVSNFLGLNQNELDLGPYAFTGKIRLKKTYFRLGLGGKASKNLFSNDFASNIFDRKTQIIDLRAGLEWQRSLTERWIFYYGLDAIGGTALNQTIATSSFDQVATKFTSLYYGGGPVLGMEFKINKRISLSTESSFYLSGLTEIEEVSFNNFPDQNSRETDNSLEFDTAIPTELFFIIHF